MNKLIAVIFLFLSMTNAVAQNSDPLPSWQDTGPKKAVIQFVNMVINPGGVDYVEPGNRVAVFDNDGTLWAEQPMYVQLAFALDRLKSLQPEHPEWKNKPFLKALMDNNPDALKKVSHSELIDLMMLTHANISIENFATAVTDWIASARHPKTQQLYTSMVYQPMLELLTYLRENGFKTYIVSGGGVEFMRPWTQAVYGIPPEQVIGSSLQREFVLKDNRPTLMRLSKIQVLNDKAQKPISIEEHIGRRPIAAFGNSDGDLQMLQWVTAGEGARLGLIVHHTDSVREWAYDRDSHVGKLDKALDNATQNGWIIADMKQDWRKVFPFDK